MRSSKSLPSIGWREWLALPTLKVTSIKAKVDTGARTSSLHAFDVDTFRRRGVELVRFKIHPLQRSSRKTTTSEAELIEHRLVRSSTGRQTLRPVIVTSIDLMGYVWDIELTLINRDSMGFRMLLGREAIRGRFVVDPGRSFLAGKHAGTSRKKNRKTNHDNKRKLT